MSFRVPTLEHERERERERERETKRQRWYCRSAKSKFVHWVAWFRLFAGGGQADLVSSSLSKKFGFVGIISLALKRTSRIIFVPKLQYLLRFKYI